MASKTEIETSDPIPIGVTLEDKYRVRRILGKGSMGIVYLGSDLALEREVAIKVLSPKYAADARIASRFRREAVAMASVRNDNVVQIFSFGDHEGCPYFIMEHIPGYTVANLIDSANQRGEHLYLDVVLGILRQVGRGLQAVHEQGIVHRDVKPANMLVGPGFRVAIADFGLVENVDHSEIKRNLAGTPLYLAPELIRRDEIPEHLRHCSDIYALGISAYEMLTGDVPFDGATVKDILQRHVEQVPSPVTTLRADLPSSLDEVISKALSKTPSERYGSCNEFISALNRARTGAATAAPRVGNYKLLVVDDEPENLTTFKAALKVGFPFANIMTAKDGVAGLEMTKTSRPDLAIVDLDLSGMNGVEVCATLRGDELTANIPIIVIASNLTRETHSLLKTLGVQSVLKTPVELSQLVSLVRQHLER